MFKLNGKSATVQISKLWALGHSRSLVFSVWRGGSGIFNYTLNTSKEKIHFGSPVCLFCSHDSSKGFINAV